MVGHLPCDLQLAAIGQVFGDAGGPEGVAADFVLVPACSAQRPLIRHTSDWLIGRLESALLRPVAMQNKYAFAPGWAASR